MKDCVVQWNRINFINFSFKKFHSIVSYFQSRPDVFSILQQLLSSADASVGVQLSLEQNQTSQTCLERIQDVPVLPLPFANPQLTRVTFATGISLESLESEWDPQLTKSQQGNVNMYRNRSRSSPARDGILSPGIQDLRDSNVIAESRNRHGSDCRAISSEEWLKRVKQNRGDSSKLVIVGASDYDPTRLKCSREGQWVSLERRAAAGLRGVPRENFKPSVLAADRETENSHMPFCVVNGGWETGLHVTVVWEGIVHALILPN